MAEIIFFDKNLSAEETRKVETYLAIKYSINITKNTEADLRHYLNLDDAKVWDYPMDVLYQEEVLGLGRNDAMNFNQTQTYSSDASSIYLGFSDTSRLGKMPSVKLANESYLVLSKKKVKNSQLNCDEAPTQHHWKVHFHKWNELNPSEAFLWFDTLLDLNAPPLLTNGLINISLDFQETENGTKLTIPLLDLDYSQDYFIIFQSTQPCDPLARIEVNSCLSGQDEENKILLQVNEEGLEAQVQLFNRSSGDQYSFELEQNNGEIAPLPSGQYEMVVSHDGKVLINQVFQLDECGDEGDLRDTPQLNQSNNSTNGFPTTFPQGGSNFSIVAYPNPINEQGKVSFYFNGFKPTYFDVQISDAKGQIIHLGKFALNKEQNMFTYFFQQPGVYNVLFTNSGFSEVKRIIVH